MNVTDGTLLGGRVLFRQPATGHRSGIEPVLLAASVPARPGARVLEGGSGAGAGLLCLAARVPGLVGIGVELAPAPLSCAETNVLANQAVGIRFVGGDLTDAALDLGETARFDHAIANPPWHPPGTISPDTSRELARRAPKSVFALWSSALVGRLRHHGSLTLIVPATALPEALAATTGAVLALAEPWVRLHVTITIALGIILVVALVFWLAKQGIGSLMKADFADDNDTEVPQWQHQRRKFAATSR